MRRKALWRFGARPHTVSVFEETTASGRYVRVRWRRDGRRETRSWSNTTEGRREAKAFAQALAQGLGPASPKAPATLGELWQAYIESEFDALRPKTQLNYGDHWRSWITYAGGAERLAEAVTREGLDGFRKALKGRTAVSQIRKRIELVKRVFRFAVDRELIPPTRLTEYRMRVAKEERGAPTVEYAVADYTAILAQLDPMKPTQWRAWLFCVIALYMGARTRAILHIQWTDIQDGYIRWRSEWDKTGRERLQPMPEGVKHGLTLARMHAADDHYAGVWVLYTPKQKERGDSPLTYRAIWWQLQAAEKRAGVAHVRWNAMHRFRRTAAGNVLDKTGDAALAMEWIGDSPRQAEKYIKARSERLVRVAALLSEPEKGQ